MRIAFMRSAVLLAALSLLPVSPVSANIDWEAEKLADAGNWYRLHEMYAIRDFDSLTGLQKYVYLAAARLNNENRVADVLRGKLTAADLEDVDHWMPNPDGAYMDLGEAVLYAMVQELAGDFDEALKYVERGYGIFNQKSEGNIEQLEQWEVGLLLRLGDELQSVYALILTRMNIERPPKTDLAAAYAQIAEEIRLVDEIQASAKALGIDLDSLLADTSAMKDTLTVDTPGHTSQEPPTEHRSPGQLKEARACDSIFRGVSANSIDYVNYYRGNNLAFMGEDSAAESYYRDIAFKEPECSRFWKPMLERPHDEKWFKFTIDYLKLVAKDDKSDKNVWLYTSDCFRAMGKPKKAVEEISKHLQKTSPTSVALSTRGRAYVDLKDFASAEKDASAALALDSTNYEGWYVLGLSDQGNGGTRAREYFQKAYELAPRELQLRAHAKQMAE